ncbi:MAG: hypothetical protein K2G37_05960 [Clostridia bacterium]|nr:hypothetical protein [Clostridia bacterium]MDE7328660.1 hypothetical protein [Clostridia bacterium]
MQLKSNIPISKIDCYINFAVKAGKVVWGVDNLERAKRAPAVTLYDETLGASSRKQLEKYCNEKKVKSLALPKDYLNVVLKRENVKVISISDVSLASAILAYCEE